MVNGTAHDRGEEGLLIGCVEGDALSSFETVLWAEISQAARSVMRFRLASPLKNGSSSQLHASSPAPSSYSYSLVPSRHIYPLQQAVTVGDQRPYSLIQ